MKLVTSFTILAASALIGSWASTGHAQGEPNAAAAEQTAPYRPNRVLLVGGGVLFVGAYIPSIIVAASSLHDGDKNLYIPVVGPWIDLGDRPKCGDGAGRVGCGTELINDSLLVLSGVAQAAGVVGIAMSVFVPEQRKVAIVTGKASPAKAFQIHFTPASLGRGAPGVAAVGTW